jgi:hypothetical protein
MKRLALVVVVVVAGGRSVHADGTTKLFPLSGAGLPAGFAGVSEAMTKALATAIHADITSVPIEDAAGLLTCDVETTACLDAVAKSVAATRIVFGTITVLAHGVKVRLTRFDPGPDRAERVFELHGQTVDALASELVTVSAPLFEAQTAPPAPKPPVALPAPPTPVAPIARPAGPVDTGDSGHASPTMSTWAILGGGVVVAGIGTASLISAHGLRDDVANAPKDTLADFQRLVALEDKGRFRTNLGYALVGIGGAAVVFGVVRVVLQRGSRATDERRAVRVDPVPTPGGAALVISGSWW